MSVITEETSTRDLLKPTEAAAYVRMSRRTMENLNAAGQGPLRVELTERIIRYRRADLDAWVAARLTK